MILIFIIILIIYFLYKRNQPNKYTNTTPFINNNNIQLIYPEFRGLIKQNYIANTYSKINLDKENEYDDDKNYWKLKNVGFSDIFNYEDNKLLCSKN